MYTDYFLYTATLSVADSLSIICCSGHMRNEGGIYSNTFTTDSPKLIPSSILRLST